jgi:hypothetical protein
MRIGHHASAHDRNGQALPDKIWGWDMPVVADFPSASADPWPADNGLTQAREWAREILASDERAASVSLRQSIQASLHESWKEGPSVEAVEREAEAGS